jgi:hypothetical protein
MKDRILTGKDFGRCLKMRKINLAEALGLLTAPIGE